MQHIQTGIEAAIFKRTSPYPPLQLLSLRHYTLLQGGVIAKRLLAYPSTFNTTSIAITLATPLEAPVINFDIAMNDYYMLMRAEWDFSVNRNKEAAPNKILLSFGNGPRDILMPSGLTFSSDSSISALVSFGIYIF